MIWTCTEEDADDWTEKLIIQSWTYNTENMYGNSGNIANVKRMDLIKEDLWYYNRYSREIR